MQVIIDLQNAVESTKLPSSEKMQVWISLALEKANAKFKQPEITIRIVSVNESQQLNTDYRAIDRPTNVLSFPFEVPDMIPAEELDEFLGDLVICEQVVVDEANLQHKTLESHWAHMIIHGVFHLLGFDHIEENEAEEMEGLEVEVLTKLGFNNPY